MVFEVNVGVPNVAVCAELDAFLGHRYDHAFAYCAKISANSLKLSGWHGDDGIILGIWNSKVLAVDVHKFELKVRNTVLVRRLKHKGDLIAIVASLHRNDIIVPSALQDLAHVSQIYSLHNLEFEQHRYDTYGLGEACTLRLYHGEIAIAAIVFEAIRPKH